MLKKILYTITPRVYHSQGTSVYYWLGMELVISNSYN